MKLAYIQQAAPDKSAYLRIIKKNIPTKTYVVGTQKNRLNEAVALSTQNACSNGRRTKKIITILRSKSFLSGPLNTHNIK